MILKKTVVALGIFGLMYGGDLLACAATASALYCAQWIHCTNSSWCEMRGPMAEQTYNDGSEAMNDTRVIPFSYAAATDIQRGEFLCEYRTKGNWPSWATFLSNAAARLFPVFNNKTKWTPPNQDGDSECVSESTLDCALSTERSTRGLHL